LSTALRARLVAELYCLVMLVMYSLFTLLNIAYYIKQVRTKVSEGLGWRPAPQLDRSCPQVLTSLTISNGTGWSPDGTTMRLAGRR
jgi:hypothetical protein